MPALTVSTDLPSRSASPDPPPMSPITPTETPSSPNTTTNPTTTTTATTSMIPPPASLAHTTHPSHTPSQPAPPPQPIDFDDNADAIALRSAISVLQLQRKKADQHIRLLNEHREDAASNPERTATQLAASAGGGNSSDLPPWKDAFRPQAVGRCPEINWDQYAVVGEPLDRIHKEQVTNPAPTEPSVYVNGVYEAGKNGGGSSQAKAEEYRGPLAAYSPWQDKEKVKPKK